jgi:hypothetical protein
MMLTAMQPLQIEAGALCEDKQRRNIMYLFACGLCHCCQLRVSVVNDFELLSLKLRKPISLGWRRPLFSFFLCITVGLAWPWGMSLYDLAVLIVNLINIC